MPQKAETRWGGIFWLAARAFPGELVALARPWNEEEEVVAALFCSFIASLQLRLLSQVAAFFPCSV